MRLIDADALIENIECLFKDLNSTEDYMGIGYNHGVGDCIAIAKNIPTIEAEPVKRGKWIKNDGKIGWHCSVCQEDDLYAFSWNSDTGGYDFQDRYCPNCGALMEYEEGVKE